MMQLPAFIVFLLLAGLVSLVILLAILPGVPLTGTVVRLRANYNPRGVQLDPEDGEQPRTGQVVTSFFAILARVHRFEGWSGLYKGLMPTLLSIPVSATLFLLRLMSIGNLRIDKDGSVSTKIVGALCHALLAIFFSPLLIILIRAVTTPHKLPYFDATYALRILLTPAERERPWILYRTPGLVAAQLSQIVFIILGLGTARRLLLPELSQADLPPAEEVSGIKVAIFLALALAGTIVLTPLDVILIRLAVQRNQTTSEFDSVSQANGDVQVVDYAAEDVISLRTEQELYTGLFDCAKKIVEEEGWRTLYRAWWWTMLGLAFI